MLVVMLMSTLVLVINAVVLQLVQVVGIVANAGNKREWSRCLLVSWY